MAYGLDSIRKKSQKKCKNCGKTLSQYNRYKLCYACRAEIRKKDFFFKCQKAPIRTKSRLDEVF